MSKTDTAVENLPDLGTDTPARSATTRAENGAAAAESVGAKSIAADAEPDGNSDSVVAESESADSEAGVTPDGDADASTPPPPSRWSRTLALGRRFLLPATALVAIAALVAAGILGRQLHTERARDAAARDALAAARTYAVTLTSVDANNLDRDFAAVLDGATGDFKDMYSRSSGQLRQLLLENKATGKGTVLEAAVKSGTETEVEVLLFIDQTVTNAASADPRVDRSRVEMTMRLVDGRWLASRVYLP
ncbi:hypothetical protein ACTD5D_27705 [Nocardia takedensis]|uniref:hypothetical protein n=1 Tax=Nocardia takedensis TaxID=259390 RepID=UPI001FE12DFD|nr:hypothetical protein [Nocardia takedensis]